MKILFKFYLVFSLVGLSFLSYSNPKDENNKVYKVSFVEGVTNNKIEVLDFGGKGQPIIFLAGLGNSAHVFVDFAPKFKDKFHVFAMTRRGFGASEQTSHGYVVDTLAMDILSVIKSLKLKKVILIGHSIAGDEISKFASTYHNEVDKVVYLDAAYDRSNLIQLWGPFFGLTPTPNSTDSSSLKNLQDFTLRTSGVMFPDDEFRNVCVFSKEGRFQKDVTPFEVQLRVVMGVGKPNYKGIKCPALAIYVTGTSVKTFFPFYDSLSAENKKKAEAGFSILENYGKKQMEIFETQVAKGVVKGIEGANHCIFLSHPKETEDLIRAFLK
jgi:pimeloyl-ACP methyl ester carboxylesterase